MICTIAFTDTKLPFDAALITFVEILFLQVVWGVLVYPLELRLQDDPRGHNLVEAQLKEINTIK